MVAQIEVKHLGRVLRRLAASTEQPLPTEFSDLLAAFDAAAAAAVLVCPRCRAPDALEVVRPAEVGRNLDERRCRFCGQIVLELVER